jgi:hypothetical protein
VDAFRVAVGANDMMADGCQATACDQTNVTTTHYANVQEFTLRRCA